MRLAALIVAVIVVAAPQAGAKGPPSQVLGFLQYGGTVAVAKLDALTLKPITASPRIRATDASLVARVAGGGRAALATGYPELRFLELRRMRPEFRIRYPGSPAAAVWNFADRLVTLNQTSTAGVIVVDPTKHRLGAVRSLGGSLAAYAVTDTRIVALVSPLAGIGPTKLAVIDDRGRVRIAALPQVRAGSETVDNGALQRFEFPALAVDRSRAVVITPEGTVVEARLDTLATTTRVVARAPAAATKAASGSTRTAQWVTANVIAVTGADSSFDAGGQRSTPAGLTFVDTRDWSAHRIDTETVGVAQSGYGPGCIVCGGTILAYGSNGIAGYDAEGRLKFRLFAGTTTRPSAVVGMYAYVGAGTHFTIIDVATGAIVKTVDTQVPTFLTSSWTY